MRALIFSIMTAGIIQIFSGCAMEHGDLGNPSSVPIDPIDYDALFVTNGGDNSLTVINTSTNEVRGTIALKNVAYPHHMSLSQDRSRLALAVPGKDLSAGHGGGGHAEMGGALLLLDASTGETMVGRRLEMSNHNAIFSPDGKEIWTSQMAMSSGTVLVLNAATLEIAYSINVGNMPSEVSFSSDGKYAFAANGMSDNVTVIDAASKQVIKNVPVGSGPVGAWTGSNNMMYVDNEAGKSLTAIDAATLEVVRTYDLGFTPGMAATLPNQELWVTNTDNGKVAFYSMTSDSKLGELATGAGAHGLTFTSDGAKAYVSNQAAGTVSVIDVPTHTITASVSVGSKPNGLVFRPKL